MNYLFIGDGRIARHMSHYLSEKGQNISVWSRRSRADLSPLLSKAHVICLSTRDHEIPGVIKAYKLDQLQKPIVHFSGSQQVAHSYGLHPLMSFGTELYPLDVYENMHFVGVPDQALFKNIFPSLNNKYQSLNPKNLALYHSYCSMAGNFPQILWSELTEKFESDLALNPEALKPYIEQVAKNFSSTGKDSTTGPLVRNDGKTLVRHLDALNGNSLQGIYFSFVNLFKKKNGIGRPHESSGISTDQI